MYTQLFSFASIVSLTVVQDARNISLCILMHRIFAGMADAINEFHRLLHSRAYFSGG